MTAITEQIPVAEVSRRAHQVRFGQTVLAIVTGVLFGLGWLVAKVLSTLWLVLAWAFAGILVGWEHAQVQAATPRMSVTEQAALLAEVDALRREVARLTGG